MVTEICNSSKVCIEPSRKQGTRKEETQKKETQKKEMLDFLVATSTLKSNAQQLKQLNREYLELLKQQAALPGKISAKLQTLNDSQCEAISATCVPLFSINLDDKDLWLALFSNHEQPKSKSTMGNSALLNLQCNFVVAVLSFAWHLARHDRLAAQILLDVNEVVVDRLCNAPITRLPLIAQVAVDWLTPRWPNNPRFWPELLRHARQNKKQASHLTHLLGRQLLASHALKKSRQANKLLQRQQDISSSKLGYAMTGIYHRRPPTKFSENTVEL